jgi:hypothetical protein
LARRMSVGGKAQAARFSWTRTAEMTRRVYQEAMEAPTPTLPRKRGREK